MSRKEAPRPGLLKAALAGRITNQEAATALGISRRQVQRLKRRWQAGGLAALLHGLRGRPSNRRLPAPVRRQAATLLQTTYAGFNDVHLTEKLRELHELPISRPSVRRLRQALGIPAQRPRRPPKHRSRRARADAVGRLVQLDGSPFAWLEDRGPGGTLLGAIDDASGQIVALWFRPEEDLHGYAVLLNQLGRTHGLPLTLYGDRLNVFVRNDVHWTRDEQLAGAQSPTHFGRMLQELGIGYIAAGSPQAKGRIERLWATLQDRLVKELRLRRVATLAAANAYLPIFITDYNRRFAAGAATLPAVWRKPPREFARVLSCRYARVVARDNTVTVSGRVVQLPPGPRGRSWAGLTVDVRELLDGRLLVFAADTLVTQQPPPGPGFILKPRSGPGGDRRRRQHLTASTATPQLVQDRRSTTSRPSTPSAKTHSRPAADHPWLRSLRRHVALKALRTAQRRG